MNKEMLDIVNDLSKKPTTELALQIMELTGENLILEQQVKKQKEVISRAIELLNNPWSFESGNKEVDEITYNKKRKVIDILKEVSE